MYFKQRYNCFFRELLGHRDGVVLEIAPDEFSTWLGCIDRSVARTLPGAREIALDFSGWRLLQLDAWQWLDDDKAIVGCVIKEGVFAVLDYQRPLLKKLCNPSTSRD